MSNYMPPMKSEEVKREKHWTDKGWRMIPCRYCVFPDGRFGHHGVPAAEPEPWRSWRNAANRHCSTCFGQGFAPNATRRDHPLGYTPGGIPVYPCECTQPHYTFPVRAIHEEAYTLTMRSPVAEVETVPA